MVRYTLEQRVFLYVTHVKYGSPRKCQRKFSRKFRDERILSRQTVHYLVNKLRTTGFLIDKKQNHKRRVLTEEKLDDIGVRLKHTHTETSTSRPKCQSLVQEENTIAEAYTQ
jgi:hypothetical protein